MSRRVAAFFDAVSPPLMYNTLCVVCAVCAVCVVSFELFAFMAEMVCSSARVPVRRWEMSRLR
jgi:hypothetical protein